MFRSASINGKTLEYANDCANDLWIREIVFPGKTNGYFVEAGAADGMGGSSCYFLEKDLGWKGICIEPHDDFFNRLRENRPNSVSINACLSRQPGTVEFVEPSVEGEVSPYLSGVRDVMLRCKDGAEAVIAAGQIVSKPAVRLSDLLDSHRAPQVIEYGAFDIEGSELEALSEFPFHRYRFLALSLEVDSRIERQLGELLVRNRYVRTSNPYNIEFPAEQYWLHKSMVGKRYALMKWMKGSSLFSWLYRD